MKEKKEYLSQLTKIQHYQNYPEMIPYVGNQYDSLEHKKLLLIGESHFFPNDSTYHLNASEWYKGNHSNLNSEEKKWIDTTQILLNKLNKVTHDIWYGNLIEGLLLTIVGRENADRVGGRLKDVCRCVQMISGAKKKMEL